MKKCIIWPPFKNAGADINSWALGQLPRAGYHHLIPRSFWPDNTWHKREEPWGQPIHSFRQCLCLGSFLFRRIENWLRFSLRFYVKKRCLIISVNISWPFITNRACQSSVTTVTLLRPFQGVDGGFACLHFKTPCVTNSKGQESDLLSLFFFFFNHSG